MRGRCGKSSGATQSSARSSPRAHSIAPSSSGKNNVWRVSRRNGIWNPSVGYTTIDWFGRVNFCIRQFVRTRLSANADALNESQTVLLPTQ